MAALHPTESALPFQEGNSPEVRPETFEHSSPASQRPVFDLLRPNRMKSQIQRLCFVMRYMNKIMYIAEEQAKREAAYGAVALPTIPPLPPEGGEYRLFYLSPAGLLSEKKLLQTYNAGKLTDVLHLCASILNSYCGLIRNMNMDGTESEDTLSSMAEVLQVALRGILDTEEVLDRLEPVPDCPLPSAASQT